LNLTGPEAEVEAVEIVVAADTLFVEKAAEVADDMLEVETIDAEVLVVALASEVVLITEVEAVMEMEAVKDNMVCVLATVEEYVAVPPVVMVPPGPEQVSSRGQHPPRPLSPMVHTSVRGQ
jgi:hypothetical protein